MIDLGRIEYRLILVTEQYEQLNITDVTSDLGWEENEGELAMRLYFTVHNATHQGAYISSIAKLNCIVAVIAQWNGQSVEVARGHITEWEPFQSGDSDELGIVAYDELYAMQKSEDNRYIAGGTGTKSALTAIFSDWGISLGVYNGPDVSHGKTVYKNDSVSDIILDLLDTAYKQGAEKCLIRADKNTVSVLPRGSNSEIYHFDESNLTQVQEKMSTADLVTRVRVLGTEDDDGRRSVEATVDGHTEFGIRQQIVIRGSDDDLEAARSSAQEILNEDGEPTHVIAYEGPDVPTIRKGDLVHIKDRSRNGYFYVLSIQHDAANAKMTMEVEAAE